MMSHGCAINPSKQQVILLEIKNYIILVDKVGYCTSVGEVV